MDGKGLGWKFDGTNDTIDCGTSTTMNPANMTILLWMWLAGLGDDGGTGEIITRSNSYRLLVDIVPYVYLYIYPSTNFSYVAIDQERWCHIAATFDGTNINTYYNATKGTSGISTAIGSTANKTYVGSFTGATRCFQGNIGDILMFNRVLSLEEIKSHYQITRFHYGSVSSIGT